MKKIICFICLINISVNLFAQQKNNEIGFKAITVEHLLNTIYIDGNLKSVYFISPFKTFSSTQNGFQLLETKAYTYSKGFSIPDIVFRKRMYNRLWFATILSAYVGAIKSDTAFGYSEGTQSTSYSVYNNSFKSIILNNGIQFEWLRKKIKAYSGLQCDVYLSSFHQKEKGYTNGCFGGDSFDIDKKNTSIGSNLSISITNYFKMPLYKNYYIGYENLFKALHTTFFHSIVLSKQF